MVVKVKDILRIRIPLEEWEFPELDKGIIVDEKELHMKELNHVLKNEGFIDEHRNPLRLFYAGHWSGRDEDGKYLMWEIVDEHYKLN